MNQVTRQIFVQICFIQKNLNSSAKMGHNIKLITEIYPHFMTRRKFLQVLSSTKYSLCGQWLKNSVLKFNVAPSGLKRIRYFSSRQSMHFPLIGLNGWLFFKNLYEMVKGLFWSLRAQTCFETAVLLLLFLKLKSHLWFA